MVTQSYLCWHRSIRMLSLLVIIIGYLSFFGHQSAKSETLLRGDSKGMTFQVEQVAKGLDIPWGMAFLNRSQMLITEKDGRIGLLNLDTRKMRFVQGGPQVWSSGQGGLLDVAIPDDHSQTGWIYFTYSKPQKGGGATTLARARLQGLSLVDWQDLLVTRSVTSTGRHFGSRIAFDGKGNLFFSIGDRGVRKNGQDLSTHAGSILRLSLNGDIPQDNPFVKMKTALPEIWSFGHRNPQGILYDKRNARLWSIEHGPRGGDELNLVLPGRNYGWPVISYGKEYWGPIQVGEGTEKEGMEQPVKVYTPSIAPGSLMLYAGSAFPAWKGNLFAGALAMIHLNRIELNADGRPIGEERLLIDLDERIRALVESPEGWIYFSTDSGKILRLRP